MAGPPLIYPSVSETVRELMRKGAEMAQELPQGWLDQLDQSLFSSYEGVSLLEDPVLLASCRRANRAELLHWANANLHRPGEPVEQYVSADMVDVARELARRGLSDLLMNTARVTQSAAWELWMKVAFSLTRDPVILEELLAVSLRSISGFIESNMRLLTQVVLNEKNSKPHDDHINKRSLVNRLLEGSFIDIEDISRQLGYSLLQCHHACLVWSEAPEADICQLENFAHALSNLADTAEPLIVFAGPATLWVWSGAEKFLDMNILQRVMQSFPTVRVAVGSQGKGLDGFRRSHFDALTTQRVMCRLSGTPAIASIEQVRMVSLMTQDTRAAKQFISSTLGRLELESTTLQRCLHTFLLSGCNITRTAEALGTHRNTLLRRLERAQSLLPVQFEDHRIQISAALELLIWSCPQTAESDK